MNTATPILPPKAGAQNPTAFTLNKDIVLQGTVRLESPFRAWRCTLNDFTGGAFSYVSPECRLHRVTVGRYCSVGHQVEILSQHPTNGLTTSPFPYQSIFAAPFDAPPQMHYENLSDTSIGNDVWIGAGVRIKSGVRIGDGVIIGAGSVITKDVPPFSIVGGTPAKLIRMRFTDALIERITRLSWWRFNLLGLAVPFDNPEAAVDALESILIGDATPLPYTPGFYRVWREDGKFKAKQDDIT